MTVNFQNNTDLPIVVETWIKVKDGLSRLIDICVSPHETKEINSLTGECNIHRMFCEKENNDLWSEYIINKTIPIYLGKFRNQKAFNNEYIWLDTELFSLKEKDNIFIWDINIKN
jgi:hypothetical protein